MTSALSRSSARLRLALLGLAAAAAVGCASFTGYSPSSLKPGATIAETEKAMGRPTGSYVLPEGRRRLEYARGPLGKHTYMLDFGADAKLKSWEQVLDDAHFQRIAPGMPKDEVLKTIGHPSEVRFLSFQKRDLWSYRFDSNPFCLWYQVTIDTSSRVFDAGYGPDPLCDINSSATGP